MALLSVLPGRVRFEFSGLVGRRNGCKICEGNLLAVKGVMEASANHRTGGVLVRFDEKLISRAELDICLRKALEAAEAAEENKAHTPPGTAAGDNSYPAGRLVMEMVIHAILPAPLDFILPAAMGMLRRQPSGT